MGKKKDIIPFDSGKSSRLIPAGDVEAARRHFETPKREITVSEVYSYYQRAEVEGNSAKKIVESRALVPLIEKKLPMLLAKYNTLEELRLKTGGDKTRRQLEATIDGMLSFEEGMKRLKDFQSKRDFDYRLVQQIRQNYGKSSRISEDDEVHLATSLTSEEITWLSVSKGIPQFVFEHRQGVVPAIVDHFWDGVEWGKDTLKYGESLTGQSRDTYEEVGITGIRNDTTFIRFEPKFALAMKGIYYSYVADSYIFDRCLEEMAGSATVSGDGKILHAMAVHDGVVFTDEYARENRYRVNEFVSSVSFTYILDPRKPWGGLKAVQLIGLLDRMPEILFDRKNLAFIPSGKGVMFLDPADLSEIVYVPLDPFVSHIAQNEIYHSSEAIDRENPLWNFIFRTIRDRIVARNLKEKNFSTLERLAHRMKKEYGVDVALGVEKYAARQDLGILVGNTRKIHYTVKMGYSDLFTIDSILAQVPKSFLTGIKKIERKHLSDDVYAELMTGVYHRGSFDRRSGTLELTVAPLDEDNPDSPLDIYEVIGESYTYTMTHEIGHAVHFSSHELWKEWKTLSRARKWFPPNKREGEFLTAYGSTAQEEDFSETFACYMYFHHEFKALAQKRPVLQKKYEFMNRLFKGRVFDQRTAETIHSLRGPLTYDFHLREKLLEREATYLASDKHQEVLDRVVRQEERKEEPVQGPVIQPLDVVDHPEKEKLVREETGKDFSRIDIMKLLGRVLRRTLKRDARFVDADFLEMRITRNADIDAALDIANSLACSKEKAERIVARCRKAIEDFHKKMESIDEQIDQIGKRPDLE